MITAESLESLGDGIICFAGNASYGIGGQGEFLRQMVFSLDLLPKARVYSRHSKANHAECVNLPFVGLSQRAQFDLLRRTPWLRRRRGWLALLSDINFDKFHPSHKRDDVFRVLAVATIEPRKGIHYLLQAFEEAKIPNSELVIIGATGDRWSSYLLRDFLRRNRNIRTCAMDIMSTPVAESLGVASVIVHPALEDGYGLVVPQALASGRPVIATRQAGASELIKDGENGFVVESRS